MKKVIDKWKLNKSLLASKIDMSNVVFCNKLKDNKFTDKEMVRLKIVLKELCFDLESVSDNDFNDVIKTIVK